MKLKKLSLIVALALGSLLVGTTLATAQETNTPPAKQGKRGGFSAEQQLNMLKERLNLTDEQVPKVKAVLEERAKHMSEVRDLSPEERRDKMRTWREEETKKMKEILTPEQFTKYQSIGRGKRPGGPGGGPEGAPKGGSTDATK